MVFRAGRVAEPGASRTGAFAAIIFAVLFVVGLFLQNVPDLSAGTAKITDFYGKSGNRTTMVIALYVWTVAGLAFLVFVGSLYQRLRLAEPEAGALPVVALAGGVAFVVILFVAAAILAAPAVSMAFGGTPQWGADIAGAFPQLGYTLLFIPGAFAAIVFLVASALTGLRTAVLPHWLAWFGLVAAVILLAAIMFMPFMILPLWTLGAAVALLRRETAPRTASRQQPAVPQAGQP